MSSNIYPNIEYLKTYEEENMKGGSNKLKVGENLMKFGKKESKSKAIYFV